MNRNVFSEISLLKPVNWKYMVKSALHNFMPQRERYWVLYIEKGNKIFLEGFISVPYMP